MFDEALKDANVHSLMVPGLSKEEKTKWLLYLLSAILKLILVSLTLTLIIIHKFSKAAIIASCINIVLLGISGLLDLVVFCSTPDEVPYQSDGYRVESGWFVTAFSNRHRLSVVISRLILLVSAMLATVCASPPIDGFLKDPGFHFEQLLYAAMVIGSFSPLLTTCLWMSNQFRILAGAAAFRFIIGIMILGIAHRCTNQILILRSSYYEGFTNLPKPLSSQAIKLFKLSSQNAYFAGGAAYVDYILCLITAWTRSKKWIIWTIYFAVPFICLLIAGFATSSLVQAIKSRFCKYKEIFTKTADYPPTSTFADDFCRVITANPRLNGQHWLTAGLVSLSILHVVHAVLLCHKVKWQPVEWNIAEILLLKSLREELQTEKLVSLKERTGSAGPTTTQPLEDFVTSITHRNLK